MSHSLLRDLPLGFEASVLEGVLWVGQFLLVLQYGHTHLSFFSLDISVCSPENLGLATHGYFPLSQRRL